MRPYSLYAYGQFDGRIHHLYRPWPHKDMLLVNISSLQVLYPSVPNIRCTLILMSYVLPCLITFDARYRVQPYEDLIRKGVPLVIEISECNVAVEQLDPNKFFAHW